MGNFLKNISFDWLLSFKKQKNLNNDVIEKIKNFSKQNWVSIDVVLNEYLVVLSLMIINNYREKDNLLLKWWSALSLFYWNERFSNDLDVDLYLNFWLNFESIIDKEEKQKIVFSMFKEIENNWEQKIKWVKFTFKIFWNFIESERKIQKYKWEFHFFDDGNFIDNKIWIDLSLENYWVWKEIWIIKHKKELYCLDENLKFMCMNESEILLQKIISFWDRIKINDVYDLNFLLNRNEIDIDLIKEQAILDYRKNKNHIFYWKNNEEIKKIFIERIWEFLWIYRKYTKLKINGSLTKENKIIDLEKFFLDFKLLVEERFESNMLDDFLLSNENILKNKKFFKSFLIKHLSWWNKIDIKQNKKQPEILLSDCLIIKINLKESCYELLNWWNLIKFNTKINLIEYLIENYLEEIDVELLKF